MIPKFGTDGVRGDAVVELTSPFVFALARAAARVLPAGDVVVGRDTRESGPRLEGALCAGLAAEGRTAVRLGVAPTPAVAHLSQVDDVPGIMISASHNPWPDNGLKVFSSGGLKLSDGQQAQLEEELAALVVDAPSEVELLEGQIDGDAVERYVRHLAGSFLTGRLDGLRVLLDCANGAASELAPGLFRQLGATVGVLHGEPDGRNINEGCGSTDPSDVQTAMAEAGWDVGLAFDGDADRVVAVDESGSIVDGDQIIAMCAIDRRDRGALPGNKVVVTVMSNLGFRLGMAATGIDIVETPVGDRNVLAALDREGLTLGGEQSGHVIFRDLATTGDGLLTGLQVCDQLMRTGRFLSDIALTSMVRYPQVLRNVEVDARDPDIAEVLAHDIAAEERALAGRGRILIRPSGTEPLVRVMVEASTTVLAESVADRLVAAVRRATRT